LIAYQSLFKLTLARLLARVRAGIAINEHTNEDGAVVYLHACSMGLEGSCPSG
jgi:hypothetical protein